MDDAKKSQVGAKNFFFFFLKTIHQIEEGSTHTRPSASQSTNETTQAIRPELKECATRAQPVAHPVQTENSILEISLLLTKVKRNHIYIYFCIRKFFFFECTDQGFSIGNGGKIRCKETRYATQQLLKTTSQFSQGEGGEG